MAWWLQALGYGRVTIGVTRFGSRAKMNLGLPVYHTHSTSISENRDDTSIPLSSMPEARMRATFFWGGDNAVLVRYLNHRHADNFQVDKIVKHLIKTTKWRHIRSQSCFYRFWKRSAHPTALIPPRSSLEFCLTTELLSAS